MTHNTKDHKCANVNCIARKQGTNVMDKVYYNKNAPHNQPFGKKPEIKPLA